VRSISLILMRACLRLSLLVGCVLPLACRPEPSPPDVISIDGTVAEVVLGAGSDPVVLDSEGTSNPEGVGPSGVAGAEVPGPAGALRRVGQVSIRYTDQQGNTHAAIGIVTSTTEILINGKVSTLAEVREGDRFRAAVQAIRWMQTKRPRYIAIKVRIERDLPPAIGSNRRPGG
jgi:hypothetical protein